MRNQTTMKHLLLPLLGLLACAHVTPDRASGAVDAELTTLVAQLDDAWNAHSPQAFAALFVDDATLVDPAGHRLEGKAALLADLATPGPTNQTTSTMELEAVQWLADDVVLLDAVQTLEGPGVEKLGASKGRLAAVAVRVDGAWRLLAARPSIPVGR